MSILKKALTTAALASAPEASIVESNDRIVFIPG